MTEMIVRVLFLSYYVGKKAQAIAIIWMDYTSKGRLYSFFEVIWVYETNNMMIMSKGNEQKKRHELFLSEFN